jgi:putative NIF3 family GTP cyclohydrolase 1 type 2
MKEMKSKKKIHRDKKGREFIKEPYFVGGKMKFRRIYVIDGMPADEFYEKNATALDFYLNGDYEVMGERGVLGGDDGAESSTNDL